MTATIPVTTTIDFENDGVSASAKEALEAKYTDAGAWAQYAATILESKLTSINTKLDDFNLDDFIAAATTAIEAVPTVTAGSITYTAPAAPVYGVIPDYSAPTDPSYSTVVYDGPATPTLGTPEYSAPATVTPDALVYNAPDVPVLAEATYAGPALGVMAEAVYAAPVADTLAETVYNAPVLGGMLSLPEPTVYSAGTVPDTDIAYDDDVFTDSLMTSLKAKLSADMEAGGSTGLGDAEAALFARETARQNATRALAYTEISTQFASRGFDMPPGALLAKQTEANNESAIRLSDSSSQIMAESAKLAQEWNKTAVTESRMLVDLLSRISESKIVRAFEAAKEQVRLSLEGFKETVSVVVANSQMDGQRLQSIGTFNASIVEKYAAEIRGETSRLDGVVKQNLGLITKYDAEIRGETSRLDGVIKQNLGLVTTYDAEIRGEISRLGGVISSNTDLVSLYKELSNAEISRLQSIAANNSSKYNGYSAEVSGAVADMEAMVSKNRDIVQLYLAETQGAIASVDAESTLNKVKADVFSSQVQSAVAAVTTPAEASKVKALAYTAAVSGAAAETTALTEKEKANAVAGEINSKNVLAVSDITSKFAMFNIEAAVRKYLGEVQILQGASQSAAQMVAAALNSVNVSASVGTTASYSNTTSVSASTTDTYGGWNSNTEEFEHRNPTLPVPG